MDLLNPSLLNGTSIVGFCVFLFICFAMEWIVPGRSHRRQLAAKDELIAEYRASLQRLSVVGETVDAALTSVAKRAEEAP